MLKASFRPKQNVPDSLSRGTLVEQPSPEVCPKTCYRVVGEEGMARMGYSGNWTQQGAQQCPKILLHNAREP
jgi:hypothetical protein